MLKHAVAYSPQAHTLAITASQPRAISDDLLPESPDRTFFPRTAGQRRPVRAESNRIHVISNPDRLQAPAIAHSPDSDRVVVSAAREHCSSGTERDSDDGLLMAGENSLESSVIGSPDSHSLVEASARDALTVGAERDVPDVQRMTPENPEGTAVTQSPQPYGIVFAAAGNALTVGAYVDRPDCPRMAFQRAH